MSLFQITNGDLGLILVSTKASSVCLSRAFVQQEVMEANFIQPNISRFHQQTAT